MQLKKNIPAIAVTVGLMVFLVAMIVPLTNAATNKAPEPTMSDTPLETTPTADIIITGEGPSPTALSLPSGTLVQWTNQDTSEHTVVFTPANSADPVPLLAPDQSATTFFNQPGTYTYTIDNLPEKTGTITVIP